MVSASHALVPFFIGRQYIPPLESRWAFVTASTNRILRSDALWLLRLPTWQFLLGCLSLGCCEEAQATWRGLCGEELSPVAHRPG